MEISTHRANNIVSLRHVRFVSHASPPHLALTLMVTRSRCLVIVHVRLRSVVAGRLGSEDSNAADRLDLALSLLREELRLDDHRLLREHTVAEHLGEAEATDIDDRDSVLLGIGLSVVGAELLRHERPHAVDVHGRAVELLLRLVEVAHTNLTEVTRVVLVEVDAVVVLTTGVTATSRMLTVLTDATMTGADVTTLLTVLLQAGSLMVMNAGATHTARRASKGGASVDGAGEAGSGL